jgi:hypothetical protein
MCHVGKPRKGVVAILSSQDIWKERMRNLLTTRSSRRGKDYHLQRMMGSDQRT